MGKKRPQWDREHYLRYIKEGRGQGTGADYKPWIYIHDFPSQGISSRIPGRKTGRIHHLLSRNEQYYFYLLDADPDVLDIREQFPLRLSETMNIAQRLNIRHPWKGSFPFVMTTDFLVTRRDGMYARTVKESAELDTPRVIEKFSIEYTYWQEKNIDWKIVTEKQIPRERALNCQWLYAGESAEKLIPDPELREAVYTLISSSADDEARITPAVIEMIEDTFCLPPGSAIQAYKHLVTGGILSPSLDRKLPWCFS